MRTSCCVIVLPPREISPAAEDVGQDRARRADGIDAGVVVEAAILDRDHRLHHALRDRRERHVPPLLAPFGDERREERRVERDARRGAACVRGARWRCRPPAAALGARREREAHRLSLPIAGARNDDERVAADRELAGLFRAVAVRIAEIVQPVDHLRRRQPLAAPDDERPREDARIGPLHFAVQPRVDHPRERDVVVPDEGEDNQRGDEDAQRHIQFPAPHAPPVDARTLGGLRRGRGSANRGHRVTATCILHCASYLRPEGRELFPSFRRRSSRICTQLHRSIRADPAVRYRALQEAHVNEPRLVRTSDGRRRGAGAGRAGRGAVAGDQRHHRRHRQGQPAARPAGRHGHGHQHRHRRRARRGQQRRRARIARRCCRSARTRSSAELQGFKKFEQQRHHAVGRPDRADQRDAQRRQRHRDRSPSPASRPSPNRARSTSAARSARPR